jgi:dipeptidyl aminopeptidase/acylaminoacyl peptidase
LEAAIRTSLLTLLAVAVLSAGFTANAGAKDPTVKTTKLPDGTAIQFIEVLPHDYKRRKDWYPTVLALPPGPQTQEMAEACIERWRRQWQDAGWIVLAPFAPEGEPFVSAGAKHLAPLVEALANRYAPDGAKFHLFGLSNGGRSAFTAALASPERFHSMVVIPGVPRAEETERLAALVNLPITLVVGSEDGGWTTASADAVAKLKELGGKAELVVIEGEGHRAFITVPFADLDGWLKKR